MVIILAENGKKTVMLVFAAKAPANAPADLEGPEAAAERVTVRCGEATCLMMLFTKQVQSKPSWADIRSDVSMPCRRAVSSAFNFLREPTSGQ